MKINELLKLLDNVKIDEDERHKIAEYLAQKVGGKKKLFPYTLMMKDKKIYYFDTYEKLLKSNKISPNDAYVYLGYDYFTRYNPLSYFYPFLIDRYLLPNAYLSKLGLKSNLYHVAPATGLKYVTVVGKFPDINLMAVEVVDIDNVVANTNLPTLIHGGVRNKHIDNGEVDKIVSRFNSQKLFAGYGFSMAKKIIRRYYEDNDTSLTKKVEAIRDAYNRIFKPLRIEYDLNTKQFQVGDSNEDR